MTGTIAWKYARRISHRFMRAAEPSPSQVNTITGIMDPKLELV
jgi:hypothetical protein